MSDLVKERLAAHLRPVAIAKSNMVIDTPLAKEPSYTLVAAGVGQPVR